MYGLSYFMSFLLILGKKCVSNVFENIFYDIIKTGGTMMKKCIWCKTDIDIDAVVCPNCKRPQKKKTNSGIVVAIIVFVILGFVLMIDAAISSNEKDKTEKETEKNIGDELICDKYKVVINEYKIKTGSIDSFYKVPDGQEWIGIIITATNTSDDDVSVYASDFKLTNSNGEIIDNDTITYNVWGDYTTFSGELAPGGTKTGYIAYSNTNTDNSDLKIKFECGLFQSGEYIIPLK